MARLSNRDQPYDMGVPPTELLALTRAASLSDSRLPTDANTARAQWTLAATK